MKFIHIGDLHLGKLFNDVNLLEDQKYVLLQILKRAEADDIDAVVIAGDIYDRSSPQAEAMTVFGGFVSALVSYGKKVYMIPGNHDSAGRVSYYSDIIKEEGVFAAGGFDGSLAHFEEQDAYGKVNIYMLPFVRPANVRKYFPDIKIESYDDAVRCVIEEAGIDASQRNILIGHQFVTGAEPGGSESINIGGLDNVGASAFDCFDYAALGHIHRAQKIGRDSLRYSGSPLKYSFSEASHKKSFCVVDMKEKGNVEITLEPLEPLHDVREVDGYMEELMKAPYSEDYVRVTVHDEDPYPDDRIRLLQVFPNMMRYAVSNSRTRYEAEMPVNTDIKSRSVDELFMDFYETQNGQKPDEELMKLFRDICGGLDDDEQNGTEVSGR